MGTQVIDATGQHNGTASVDIGTMLVIPGHVGTGCYDFDGQYGVDIGNESDWNPVLNTPIGVALWAYYIKDGNTQILISKDSVNTGVGKGGWFFFVGGSTDYLYFQFVDDNNSYIRRKSSIVMPQETWTCLVAWKDNTESRFDCHIRMDNTLRDGAAEKGGAINYDGPDSCTSKAFIGGRDDDAGGVNLPWNGYLEEARFFNGSVPDAAQQTTFYGGGSGTESGLDGGSWLASNKGTYHMNVPSAPLPQFYNV